MDRNSVVPQWPACDAPTRLEDCLRMLHLHGFVTDAERQKVGKRLRAWLGEPAEPPAGRKVVAS